MIAGNISSDIFTSMYLLAAFNPLSVFSACLLRLGRRPVLIGSYFLLLLIMISMAVMSKMAGKCRCSRILGLRGIIRVFQEFSMTLWSS